MVQDRRGEGFYRLNSCREEGFRADVACLNNVENSTVSFPEFVFSAFSFPYAVGYFHCKDGLNTTERGGDGVRLLRNLIKHP